MQAVPAIDSTRQCHTKSKRTENGSMYKLILCKQRALLHDTGANGVQDIKTVASETTMHKLELPQKSDLGQKHKTMLVARQYCK